MSKDLAFTISANPQYNTKIAVYELLKSNNKPWTIYSATTILEKCRKVVLEKWFCKLRFFFWSTTFLEPEKMWIYGIKPPFFLVNHFS